MRQHQGNIENMQQQTREQGGEINYDNILKSLNIQKNEHGDRERIKGLLENKYQSNSQLVSKVLSYYGNKFNEMYKAASNLREELGNQYGYQDRRQMFDDAKKVAKAKKLPDFVVNHFIRMVLEDGDFKNDFQFGYDDEAQLIKGAKMDEILTPGNKQTDDNLKQMIKLADQESIQREHRNVILQSVDYTDCDYAALYGEYKGSDDIQSAVPPSIAALFLPKFTSLEQTFLIASFGKLIKNVKQGKNIQFTVEELLKRDILHDPNQSACFDSDSQYSETEDLLRRFQVQIELWKAVYNLRTGKYYQKNKLLDLLDDCHHSYYESLEFTGIYDEGTLVKKLFNVFSFRPIYINIYPKIKSSMDFAFQDPQYYAMQGSKQKTIPMINVRVPVMTRQTHNFYDQRYQHYQRPEAVFTEDEKIELGDYLHTSDQFLENGQVVYQQYDVLDTRDIFVFYFNRRYQPVPKQSHGRSYGQSVQQAFMGTPVIQISGLEKSNNVLVNSPMQLDIQTSRFELKSVVCVKIASQIPDVIIGSYSMIKAQKDNNEVFLVYDPVNVTPISKVGQGNKPISYINLHPENEDGNSFAERAEQYGTLYIYKNDNFDKNTALYTAQSVYV